MLSWPWDRSVAVFLSIGLRRVLMVSGLSILFVFVFWLVGTSLKKVFLFYKIEIPAYGSRNIKS